MQPTAIPTFYLYGEPHREVGDGFVHIESLDDRSRPSEWTIKPHSHSELSHVFLISSGGGAMRVDGRDYRFAAPCLLIVPAMTVHGFMWLEGSTGTVVTMATRYIRDLARHDATFVAVLDEPHSLTLGDADSELVERLMADMARELSWSAPGHRAAIDAAMLALLVLILRRASSAAQPPSAPGRHVAIVARLRERIEERFRLRESVGEYATALGVSETALRVACLKIAKTSPARMLDQRALLEARRLLLYSNLSVTEVSYAIGFSDPAYFSRFFRREDGSSPRRFRERSALTPGASDLL